MIFLLFAAGLFCIIWGGDRFVEASVWIAEVSGVPRFVIGATIVSVATTLPEMIVSLMAAASGQLAMAAGNAIGSVTANTALILALSVLFVPSPVSRRECLPKILIFFAALALLWGVTRGGMLTMFGSIVLLLLFVTFLGENLYAARRAAGSNETTRVSADAASVLKNGLFFVLGAAGIVVGSRLLVDNGTLIARDILHVDERVISLTLVAVGTSLPELVTAVSAMIKRQGALTAGNILGANIIDILLILPLCTLERGGTMAVESATVCTDLPFSLIAAAVIWLPALIAKRFRRWQGAVALGVYVSYLFILFQR